jgi:hypothetical protein
MFRAVLLAALAPLTLVALLPVGGSGAGRVSADAPHAGLSFAVGINVDGDSTNDCGTGVPTAVGNGAPDTVSVQVSNTACEVRQGAPFKVNVYLMANGGVAASGISAHVIYSGVTSSGPGDSVWDGCIFEASSSDVGYEDAGCAIGLPPAAPVQAVGLTATFSFTCTSDGSIALGHGVGETSLTDAHLDEHREAGPDMLTVDCQEGLPALAGDSDCNGSVNSIDAALILQNVAGLLANLACPDGADANHNGTINSIDAALVLQFSAGLLHQL